MSDPTAALDQTGPAAPPRHNGELVFQAPWESRVFGIAIALRDSGRLDWQEFREQLIAEIASADAAILAAEAGSERPPTGAYYRHWQRALERVLDRRRLCTDAEIGGRASELAERPEGHDHPHDHNHSF